MQSADRVKEHIIRHLKWDNLLKGSEIKVDLVNGIAILSGTVPNLIAHAAAQRDALSIPGVKGVENRLVVKYSHQHPDRTDEEIRQDIQQILCGIDVLKNCQIKVTVQDGIVTLSGLIDSYWKKMRVEELAASAEGVLDVKNEIQVIPVESVPDEIINDEIKQALDRIDVKGLDRIKIKVKDGVVTLSGPVPTWSVAFDIEDTVRLTEGVRGIINKLYVE
ncbi:MAG: BON domain-containing protein [Dehalococcoidales bacterium]|jgi:osmotically-inducible protein OsmY|nr:BON domain-containing protein [Dehalococcoidales bacterium]